MSDQEQKKESANISPQPDAEKNKESAELSEEELTKVSGGMGDIPFPKNVDKSSP